MMEYAYAGRTAYRTAKQQAAAAFEWALSEAIANAGLLVLSGMLQIIVFELAVVILAVSNLSVDLGSRLAGAALAALFVIWGIHQGLAAPVLPGL